MLDYRGVGFERCWIRGVLDYRGFPVTRPAMYSSSGLVLYRDHCIPATCLQQLHLHCQNDRIALFLSLHRASTCLQQPLGWPPPVAFTVYGDSCVDRTYHLFLFSYVHTYVQTHTCVRISVHANRRMF